MYYVWQSTNEWDLLHTFSSCSKLITVVTFIKHFVKKDKIVCPLTIIERNDAEKCVICLTQQSSMSEDISYIVKDKPCSVHLLHLSPFLRVMNSPVQYDKKHSLI